MSTGHAGNKKGFFSLKTKDLGQQQPAHRKTQTTSNSYGRMLVLGPGRTGSSKPAGNRSKMAVPKPVNLPSLKAETGAMTPLAPSSSTSSWKSADEPHEPDAAAAGQRSAWGDSPAPGTRNNHEFPALGQDGEAGAAQRQHPQAQYQPQQQRSVHPALLERGPDRGGYNEYDRRDWGAGGSRYGRSPPGEERGGWGARNSPPRVEPGAIMIKKRAGGEEPEARRPDPIVARPTTSSGSKAAGPVSAPQPAKAAEAPVMANKVEEDDDGDVFTPDQGKIWSLEDGDEMDFSRPLKFGDEDEDDGQDVRPAPAADDDEEDAYIPRQDLVASDDEDNNEQRPHEEPTEKPKALSEEKPRGDAWADTAPAADEPEEREPTEEEKRAEQEALDERRRQIAARREEELRRMREEEEAREERKRELDRLRREEDFRRRQEEAEQRRVASERGFDRMQRDGAGGASVKDLQRGPARGEVRTLFNPKDPDRPIVVKPGDPPASSSKRQQSSAARGGKGDRKDRRDRDRDRDRDRPARDRGVSSDSKRAAVDERDERERDRSRSRDRERDAVPYRSSRSLVEPNAVVMEKKSSRSRNKKNGRNKQSDAEGDGGAKEAGGQRAGGKKESKNAHSAASSAKAKGGAPAVTPAKPLAPVEPPPPPEPAWEKPLAPKIVKTLAEIQREEEERERAEAERKAAPPPTRESKNDVAASPSKAKSQDKKKKNKKQRRKEEKKQAKQANKDVAKDAAVFSDNKKGSALAKGQSQSSFQMETSALSTLAPLIPPSMEVKSGGPGAAGASSQQRRLFERGHEDDDVIDTFHLERSIDAVTEEPASAPSVSSGGRGVSGQNRTRFAESAVSASAFTPGKYGLTPLPDPTYQSTWAPQTSQLDSDASSSLYSSGAEGSRYAGLFSSSGSTSQASPFAAPFGGSYGSAQWGKDSSEPSSKPTVSGQPQAASRFFPSGGRPYETSPPASSSVAVSGASSSSPPSSSSTTGSSPGSVPGGNTWATESVFALPSHILSQPESRARQPLMVNKTNPEEFGKFLERATFTPQSRGSNPAELSVGGKPLAALAAAAAAPQHASAPAPHASPVQPTAAKKSASRNNNHKKKSDSFKKGSGKKGSQQQHHHQAKRQDSPAKQ